MAEIIANLNQLTLPGAIALCAILIALVFLLR